MKPQLGLFDLDGTLVHNDWGYHYEITMEAFDKVGLERLTRADFFDKVSHHNLISSIDPAQIDEILIPLFNHIHASPFPEPVVIEGVTETLDWLLTRNISVAIVTARGFPPHEVEESLKRSGLLKYVKFISSRDQISPIGYSKSHQILDACSKFQIEPKHTFIVGDSPDDIKGGHAAELGAVVGVLSGGIRREVLEQHNPHHLLKSVAEVPRLIGVGMI